MGRGLGAEDLDPHLLLWDMKRSVPGDRWPPGRTVVARTFCDVETRAAHWWICVRDGEVDICDHDPGYEVTARAGWGLPRVRLSRAISGYIT